MKPVKRMRAIWITTIMLALASVFSAQPAGAAPVPAPTPAARVQHDQRVQRVQRVQEAPASLAAYSNARWVATLFSATSYSGPAYSVHFIDYGDCDPEGYRLTFSYWSSDWPYAFRTNSILQSPTSTRCDAVEITGNTTPNDIKYGRFPPVYIHELPIDHMPSYMRMSTVGLYSIKFFCNMPCRYGSPARRAHPSVLVQQGEFHEVKLFHKAAR